MKVNIVDVHGLTLEQAMLAIIKSIGHAYQMQYETLRVIHGSNHGQKIRNWCRKEGKKIPHVIQVSEGENEGITIFFIQLNIKRTI